MTESYCNHNKGYMLDRMQARAKMSGKAPMSMYSMPQTLMEDLYPTSAPTRDMERTWGCSIAKTKHVQRNLKLMSANF
jgi:hypothetical protein